MYDVFLLCSIEINIPSERGSTVEAIPIRARQESQSTALSSEGVCIWNVTAQVLYYTSLDIPRQPTCMKLGTRELYQPIQSCHVICLGISNESQVYTQTGQHSPLQGSCCPVWALQRTYMEYDVHEV